MNRLCDCIIISDVDGTLLPLNQQMPQRNIDALERFTSQGGRFGIATGRSAEFADRFAAELPVNLPCIVNNGGAIYDYRTKEYLSQTFLPDNAREAFDRINRAVPNLAALVVADKDYFRVTGSHKGFPDERQKWIKVADIGSITSPWYKVLYTVAQSEFRDLQAFIKTQVFPGIRFVRTDSFLFEMLPENSTKGSALQKLTEMGHIERENVVAAGDYDNDVEMLEYAAIGAVPSDAPKHIRLLADVILGPCEGGAIADLVEYLERLTGS